MDVKNNWEMDRKFNRLFLTISWLYGQNYYKMIYFARLIA